MKPEAFTEANTNLACSGEYPVPVQDLPAYRDDVYTISCWRLSWRERLRVLVSGRVWLSVLTGARRPHPVAVLAERPFEERDDG